MPRSILHVVAVESAGAYRLDLTFSDGTRGVADLAGHLTGVLEPLRDVDVFRQAHVAHGTVEWPGDLDVAAEFLYALAHELPPPQTEVDVLRNQFTVTLRELRTFAGKTQAEVARVAGLSQSDISKLEARDDLLLTTLRRYVEALGGELDIVARFGNKQMKVSVGG